MYVRMGSDIIQYSDNTIGTVSKPAAIFAAKSPILLVQDVPY